MAGGFRSLLAYWIGGVGNHGDTPPPVDTPEVSIAWVWSRSRVIDFLWARYTNTGYSMGAFEQYGTTRTETDVVMRFRPTIDTVENLLTGLDLECRIFKDDDELILETDTITVDDSLGYSVVSVPFATDDADFGSDGLWGEGWQVELRIVNAGSREVIAEGTLGGY